MKFLSAISLLLLSSPVFAEDPIQLNYDGFTIWLDCEKRSAVKFEYIAHKDGGSQKRRPKFYLDANIPKSCQQRSTRSYRTPGKRYDRGHLAPANHFDHSANAIKETNYMTNILPQAAIMNRGAWVRTETITECRRDSEDLTVIGGVIWGQNKKDDYFLETHGVKTPSAFWKVIITEEEAIAWLIPNSKAASWKRLDQYLVSIDTIETLTGETIPVSQKHKLNRLSSSWTISEGCNRG